MFPKRGILPKLDQTSLKILPQFLNEIKINITDLDLRSALRKLIDLFIKSFFPDFGQKH
jgi:hypothetical protein